MQGENDPVCPSFQEARNYFSICVVEINVAHVSCERTPDPPATCIGYGGHGDRSSVSSRVNLPAVVEGPRLSSSFCTSRNSFRGESDCPCDVRLGLDESCSGTKCFRKPPQLFR